MIGLGLLGTAAAFHVAPNIAMKAVKNTKAGHKALTQTFSAGVELGRSGKKLKHNVKDFLEYGVGPESLVEYHLGRKLGQHIQKMSPTEQDEFLTAFKQGTKDKIGSLSSEERKMLEKTPIINTLTHYADGKDNGKIKNALMKMSIPEDAPKKFRHHMMNAGALAGAGALDPHVLLQPAISGVRKMVGQSEVGKKFMKKNFEKGRDGKMMGKAARGIVDMAVSPSALDTMRIGDSFAKSRLSATPHLNSNSPISQVDNIINEMLGL